MSIGHRATTVALLYRNTSSKPLPIERSVEFLPIPQFCGVVPGASPVAYTLYVLASTFPKDATRHRATSSSARVDILLVLNWALRQLQRSNNVPERSN